MSDDVLRPAPSLSRQVSTTVASEVPGAAQAVGVLVGTSGPVPAPLGLDREQLRAHGFDGRAGDTLVVPSTGQTVVAVGVGDGDVDVDLRSVGASFARACGRLDDLALVLSGAPSGSTTAAGAEAVVAEAVVEGALLARYSYPVLKSDPADTPLATLTLVVEASQMEAAGAGADTGRVLAAATALARDLANTPHSHLSATRLAALAERLGPERGLEVEVFGKEALHEMRMAGLLAINAGSAEPPVMIRLRYRPDAPTGSLALVGKGIMYDSGGISLKPSDAVHAQMKNDMSGAAAVLAAMSALRDLGCTTAVTGYLMCTDNMPSGTATALGDVITYRDGTTVEMLDTDAEGRVVMADALILAAEEGHDAIVDIATLTGSAMRALGSDMAALFGNQPALVEQVQAAASASGELVWPFPLHRPYRKEIDSLTADMMNCAPIGKPDAIIAALFLAHFVGDRPWAHVDMCGPAQAGSASGVLVPGCTGWGARLLAHLALSFTPVPAGGD